MENKLARPNRTTGNKLKYVWGLRMLVILAVAVLANCHAEHHDDYDPLPIYETQIASDLDADGDIAFSPPDNYAVTSAGTTGSVLAGIDPAFGDEFRGFLSFPIRGSQGVPRYADIESATLEVFISSVTESPSGTGVPLLFDLVSFSPPILIASDFDRLSLLTLHGNVVFANDAGFFLSFDVTPLMVEAQRLDLTNFQIRMVLDRASASSGIIEIEDAALETAPLLMITYN